MNLSVSTQNQTEDAVMESLLLNLRLLDVQRRVQAAHCEAFLNDMERALDMARAGQSRDAEPSEGVEGKSFASNISRPIMMSPGLSPGCCQSDGSIPLIYIPGKNSPYLPSANESPMSECPHRRTKSTSIGCTPVYAAEAQVRRRRHSLSGRPLTGRPTAMSPLRSTPDSHKNVRCRRRSTDCSSAGGSSSSSLRASAEPVNATADYSRPSQL